MIAVRIEDLQTLHGDINSARGTKMVEKYTELRPNKIGYLLVAAADILEKQMNGLQMDGRISKGDKRAIREMHRTFYAVHYDVLNELCKNA
jgi:hypothetical protein